MNKMLKRPKVSIIIPVYNAEKYISKCLDSILNQTEKDFEIIIIDDGSQDRSLERCKYYGKMIKELKFYIKKIQVFQKQEILELNILMETISHLLI